MPSSRVIMYPVPMRRIAMRLPPLDRAESLRRRESGPRDRRNRFALPTVVLLILVGIALFLGVFLL